MQAYLFPCIHVYLYTYVLNCSTRVLLGQTLSLALPQEPFDTLN